MNADQYKIIIATTVPETIATILNNQPRYLKNYFNVKLVTSPEASGSTIEKTEGILPKYIKMRRGISLFFDFISILHLIFYLFKEKPDLVHSYTPKAGLVSMVSAWLCRVPIRVHTYTGLIFPTSRGFKKKLLIYIDRLICACATHVIPEGLGVKKDLEAYRITSKPLHIIGYGNIAGVETTYFSPMATGIGEASNELKTNLGISENDFVFCFVGRLNRDKGLAELMDAFSALPENTHLVLVGGLDDSAPIDKTTLEIINSNPHIYPLGFLSDIRPALHMADILVLPSYREGFPNVVLQAGAMGLPVIATDINGCNEVIEPGFNGWLVPARDAQALQQAMQTAMQAPESERDSMGQQARERIKARFERTEHWRRMEQFYHELLENRSHG